MATCGDIVRDAMIELAVLAIGEEATGAEAVLGMARLQSVVDGLYGFGVGVSLDDLAVDADTELLADQRALVGEAVTLTMPADPVNGSRIQVLDVGSGLSVTLDGNGRLVDGSASEAITAGGTWIYMADAADWQKVNPLSLTDTAPFNDDEYLVLELAKRLAPAFGITMSAESADAYKRAKNRIRARFASEQTIPCDDAVLYLSRQSFRTGL